MDMLKSSQDGGVEQIKSELQQRLISYVFLDQQKFNLKATLKRDYLKPASNTFQFDLIVCETSGPTYPVSMSLHFRATEARGEPVVTACLQQIATAIADHLGAGARLRAFAVDQSGLFSLDHKIS